MSDFTEQLYAIELNTKQSRLDLTELINRLKNNNDHLNRLLNSLVENNHITKSDLIESLQQYQIDTSKVVDQIVDKLQKNWNYAGQSNTDEDIQKHTVLQQNYNDLNSKFIQLESKYERLSEIYNQKYKALTELQSQYNEFIDRVEHDSVIRNTDTLHQLKLDLIKTRKPQKTRIVSTPYS